MNKREEKTSALIAKRTTLIRSFQHHFFFGSKNFWVAIFFSCSGKCGRRHNECERWHENQFTMKTVVHSDDFSFSRAESGGSPSRAVRRFHNGTETALRTHSHTRAPRVEQHLLKVIKSAIRRISSKFIPTAFRSHDNLIASINFQIENLHLPNQMEKDVWPLHPCMKYDKRFADRP